nr:cache domain-containing protein [uncultured Cellulosilyticum sp.]
MNLKSITTTFLAFMIALLITISLVFLITSTKIIEKRLTSDYIVNSSEQMALVAQSISKFYFRINEDLDLFANHPSLTSHSSKSSPELNQSIYYLLTQYATNHSGIQSVYFLTPDGTQVQWPISDLDSPYKTTLNTLITYFQSTGNNVFKSPPHLDTRNNAIISHISPVYNPDGDILGIIGIDVSQTYLSELLSTKITISDTGFFMLFDVTGLILADSKSPENVLKFMSDLNIFQLDTLDILTKDTLTSLELSIDNNIYVSSIVQVPYTNWFIMSLLLKSELLGPISQVIPIFAAIFILLLLISCSLMIFATKKILHKKTPPDTWHLHDYNQAFGATSQSLESDCDLKDISDLFGKMTSRTNPSEDI